MSRVCELTGLRPVTGNLVSHSNTKTRTRWLPNVKNKKFTIPELGQVVSLKLSTRAIRTIDKQGGISNAIMHAKAENLSERLASIKCSLIRARKA
ncbi:MAG: 50S ribosomal protein L28 [Methylotenera sp.]|nr:50S ribosomal protein L28 [Oligoflexia bacterium]